MFHGRLQHCLPNERMRIFTMNGQDVGLAKHDFAGFHVLLTVAICVDRAVAPHEKGGIDFPPISFSNKNQILAACVQPNSSLKVAPPGLHSFYRCTIWRIDFELQDRKDSLVDSLVQLEGPDDARVPMLKSSDTKIGTVPTLLACQWWWWWWWW